jgi:hypothetical protein
LGAIAALLLAAFSPSVSAETVVYRSFPEEARLEIRTDTLRVRTGPVSVQGVGCDASHEYFCLSSGAPFSFAVPKSRDKLEGTWEVAGRRYRVVTSPHQDVVFGRAATYCHIFSSFERDGIVVLMDFLYSPELGLVMVVENMELGTDNMWLLESERGFAAQQKNEEKGSN